MKKFDNAIARFCYKHPKFGIDRLMLYIVGGTVAVFFVDLMDTTGTFLSYLYFNPALVLKGEVWRLISFVFIPSDSGILWFALSLYFYYFIGNTLESAWGAGKFTLYYFSGVLLTVIYGFILYAFGAKGGYYFFSSTYLNLSMFFAFAALFPETRVLLFFFIPVKIKWLAYADALLFIYSIVTQMYAFPFNFLPLVAILNFFIFCGGTLIGGVKRSGIRRSATVINFKREAQQASYEESNRAYRHKCSVCGKTDIDHPELEFRYCSRCQGYHCFCSEHINSHVHFTE